MGCQIVINEGGDYILAVKGNQKHPRFISCFETR